MVMSIVRFDMRAPSFSKASASELYAATLEMSTWVESQDFTMIVLPEHHGIDDGYLPAPLPMAGAVVGRTRHIRIGIMALLLPLYDPVRLAEDLAVLDLASGGRIAVTVGQGYRPEEYSMCGVDWKWRGQLMDEYLEVMLRAWRGEAIEWEGRRITVSPLPASRPHPFIAIGGEGRNAARRAARFQLPFQPSVHAPEVFDFYRAECERVGTKPILLAPGSGDTVWVSEDPDRSWRDIGPYILHHVKSYASWQVQSGGSVINSEARTIEDLRVEGKYRILTPDECVALAGARPNEALVHLPLCGGTPPELAWQSLELYASKVLPQLRE